MQHAWASKHDSKEKNLALEFPRLQTQIVHLFYRHCLNLLPTLVSTLQQCRPGWLVPKAQRGPARSQKTKAKGQKAEGKRLRNWVLGGQGACIRRSSENARDLVAT